MTSVDKRRRERIRAKRTLRQTEEVTSVTEDETLESLENRLYTKRLLEVDGHVAAAPGRQARRRRVNARREARQIAKTQGQRRDEFDRRNFAPILLVNAAQAVTARRPSLGQRRAERHKERLRREGVDPDRPEERVRRQGVNWISWRWLSGLLTISQLVILYMMLGTNVFIVDTVAVGGERSLGADQVFDLAEVANRHLFWIDPAEVEQHMESSASIADAEVYIGWPPNMVSIIVQERDPALIWNEGGFPVWVDVNGIVMYDRKDRPDLLRIDYEASDEIKAAGSTIDREIVVGALQLKAKFPTIEVLLYDPIKGLGYRDSNNWVVWFGVGADMDQKILVYDAIVRNLYDTVRFREIDVSDPHHPTFTDRFPEE